MQKYILIFGAVIFFIYALINRPKWIAILFFTVVIAEINFDLPGVPLNFRSLLSVILFLKVLSESKSLHGPSFLSVSYNWLVIGFVAYVLVITYYNGYLDKAIFMEYMYSILTLYLGYYYFMREGGYEVFKLSMICAGFSCLGDLAWTYYQGGGLGIIRIYYSFTPAFEVGNHNFFGNICGITFVFLLSDYLTDAAHAKTKRNLILMPFMFLGVLLSTSRSTLLILIIISIILIAKGLLSRQNSSKAYKLTVISISCIVLSLFLFQILAGVFNISSEFMEQITGRLIDEPVAIFNRFMGNDFKAESLDSMDWRAEASEIAYHTYMNILTTTEQIMGIGHDGFMQRHYGYLGVYAAHNGILLMMIEYGAIGFLIYHLILLSLIFKIFQAKHFSPIAMSLIYLFFYATSHNKEMTSLFAFLMIGTLIAEVTYRTGPYREQDAAVALVNETE